MRRILAIAGAVLAVGLLIALPAATGEDGGTYKVRGAFDNGSFIVKDEEVRVAGAKVGVVESVDVSGEDEIVSLEGGPHALPGKAILVMRIDDDGFKDFRQDASCIIRPQSLIGERFVDCTPTQPRAPGTPPPPELEEIPEGEPGEGQRLLPVENNGKTIDLDLIQNIQRAPYRDRFRLILNDLGAGLAARGEDLGEVIDRANPALRQTNRVLNILALQNRQLADLASDGDAVLEPLARNRTSVTGFLRNAAIAGQATAERSEDLEAGLQRFPETLREVRRTMAKLDEFGDQGAPLFGDLRVAAPHFSKATQKLGPLATAAIPSFQTLGDAGEAAGPKLVAADPVLKDLTRLTNQAAPASVNLRSLLDTFSRTNGIKYLMDFIYYTVGNLNGFDSYGHFSRANLQVTNCIDVSAVPIQGCEAFFQDLTIGTSNKKKKKKKKKKNRNRKRKKKKKKARFRSFGSSSAGGIDYSPQAAPVPNIPAIPQIEEIIPPFDPSQNKSSGGSGGGDPKASRVSMKQANAFLRFLLGSGA